MVMLMAFIRDETGQGMTEYALMLAFVALAAVVVISQMMVPIMEMYDRAIAAFNGETGT